MSYAGFKLVKPSRLRTSLLFPFSRLTLVEPSWDTSIRSLFLSHPYCWSCPVAIPLRVSPHTESATGYAISEPTGSNQRFGSDGITIICRLCKFSTFSDISVLLNQCEVCIYFRKLFMYLCLQYGAGIRAVLSGRACACVFCPYQVHWHLCQASTYILCPSVCSYEASREPLFRFSWNFVLGGFAAIWFVSKILVRIGRHWRTIFRWRPLLIHHLICSAPTE